MGLRLILWQASWIYPGGTGEPLEGVTQGRKMTKWIGKDTPSCAEGEYRGVSQRAW